MNNDKDLLPPRSVLRGSEVLGWETKVLPVEFNQGQVCDAYAMVSEPDDKDFKHRKSVNLGRIVVPLDTQGYHTQGCDFRISTYSGMDAYNEVFRLEGQYDDVDIPDAVETEIREFSERFDTESRREAQRLANEGDIARILGEKGIDSDRVASIVFTFDIDNDSE